MVKRLFGTVGVALLLAGCPTPLPPIPDAEVKEERPPCGKVFRDPSVRGGSACCGGPSATAVAKAEVLAACGRGEADYLGETRDGAACRYHFQVTGAEPKETSVVITRPPIPPGSPAPVKPDELLPWRWKKIELRDAVGYQVVSAPNDPVMAEKRTTLWGGRGRRIVGLHADKRICNETQTAALLQRALDSER